MHTDSETTDISLLGFMPYMTVVSLEMSDEPLFSPTLATLHTFTSSVAVMFNVLGATVGALSCLCHNVICLVAAKVRKSWEMAKRIGKITTHFYVPLYK